MFKSKLKYQNFIIKRGVHPGRNGEGLTGTSIFYDG